ncbi:MAG: 4Fe-4S dicluster domain-containing protein [Thermodesulfobacteriota bacterium]
MKNKNIHVTINGTNISLPHTMTAIQALWHSGEVMIHGVGCLEGVCGVCKVLVRRADDPEISMELGCQTLVEEGMEVIFLVFPAPNHHTYQLKDFENSWQTQDQFHQVFPEAAQCRHCGGCDKACPKDIEVERVVNLAVEGKFNEASELFLQCVMCGLCLTACPERITPNHVGLFCRRITAFFHIRPSNLINRLEEIRKGELKVVID